MADDVHNPAGGGAEKGRKPGVFDPDHEGHNDPFKRPGDDDDRWDESEDEKSTRDT